MGGGRAADARPRRRFRPRRSRLVEGPQALRGDGGAPRHRRADPVHQGLRGVPRARADRGARRVRAARFLRVPRRTGGSTVAQAEDTGGGGPGDRWGNDRAGGCERGAKSRGVRHRRLGRCDQARAEEREAAGVGRGVPGRRPVRRPSQEAPWDRRCDHAAPSVRRERRDRGSPGRDPRMGTCAHAHGPQRRRPRPDQRERSTSHRSGCVAKGGC